MPKQWQLQCIRILHQLQTIFRKPTGNTDFTSTCTLLDIVGQVLLDKHKLSEGSCKFLRIDVFKVACFADSLSRLVYLRNLPFVDCVSLQAAKLFMSE